MESQPSLKEMTQKAIARLKRSINGYLLFVEGWLIKIGIKCSITFGLIINVLLLGGRIDHAHHDGLVRLSLEETVAFDDAVKAAVEMTNEDDTLIVVTADHSHVMTINGYPKRGSPILGKFIF